MNIVLFDQSRENLLPLTFLRPVAEIRCGILTLSEKWKKLSNGNVSFITENYLSKKYGATHINDNIYIAGNVIATTALWEQIKNLKNNHKLVSNNQQIALRTTDKLDSIESITNHKSEIQNLQSQIFSIDFPYHIFSYNDYAIKEDFKLLTHNRQSEKLSSTNTVVGDASLVFLEKGAKVECAMLNTTAGPIYAGANAEIMEGCMIRGPFALGEHAILKMGAKIYGATTIGPECRAGGEVSNSVMFAYSNKGHDGFLGNSVIAEWCNLGADTNNSNLKNNYGLVDIYNYAQKGYINTGLQFCGLIMSDHSKAGINTMFNTGTVAGVNANIFGAGFPPKYIPSFSWGGFENSAVFKFEKAVELAIEVMKRRKVMFDKTEQEILKAVFELEMMGR
ncbi:MAG TPA: GlmU family protein [Bacteroidia bacterium]|nr:GlmU family protein [Bacteroidia bacterium]HNU34065.1 GlmU family protein [Bacteroidia bacterium]